MGEGKEARAVDMGGKVVGEGVERLIDCDVIAFIAGGCAKAGKEGAAEGVFGEHAVKVAAHHAAVLADGAFGLAVHGEHRAGPVGAFRAAKVDFIAFDAGV